MKKAIIVSLVMSALFMAYSSQPVQDAPTHGFEAIINAYAKFEQSGFTILNDDLIASSYFVVHHHHLAISTWSSSPRLRWEENPPYIIYAFFDINGDGTPELFIGGNRGRSETPSLIAIYTLMDGVPARLIYESSNNIFLDLVEDIYGNYNIRVAGGRFGTMWDEFYTLDENGDLIEVGGFYSREGARWCECCSMYGDGYFIEFYQFYDGRFMGDDIMITQDEYNVLLIQFGIYGNIGRVELPWERILQE